MNTNIKSFKFARHVLRNMKKKGDDMDPELWDKYFGPDTIVISGDEKNPDYDYISDYDSDTISDSETELNNKEKIKSLFRIKKDNIVREHNRLYKVSCGNINFDIFDKNYIEILKKTFCKENELFNMKIIAQIHMYSPVENIEDNIINESNSLTDSNLEIIEDNSNKVSKFTVIDHSQIYIADILIDGTMSFIIEFTPNNKIKNIIFELTAKKIMDIDENPIDGPNDINIKIPMLKENPNGYNYKWCE